MITVAWSINYELKQKQSEFERNAKEILGFERFFGQNIIVSIVSCFNWSIEFTRCSSSEHASFCILLKCRSVKVF